MGISASSGLEPVKFIKLTVDGLNDDPSKWVSEIRYVKNGSEKNGFQDLIKGPHGNRLASCVLNALKCKQDDDLNHHIEALLKALNSSKASPPREGEVKKPPRRRRGRQRSGTGNKSQTGKKTHKRAERRKRLESADKAIRGLPEFTAIRSWKTETEERRQENIKQEEAFKTAMAAKKAPKTKYTDKDNILIRLLEISEYNDANGEPYIHKEQNSSKGREGTSVEIQGKSKLKIQWNISSDVKFTRTCEVNTAAFEWFRIDPDFNRKITKFPKGEFRVSCSLATKGKGRANCQKGRVEVTFDSCEDLYKFMFQIEKQHKIFVSNNKCGRDLDGDRAFRSTWRLLNQATHSIMMNWHTRRNSYSNI